MFITTAMLFVGAFIAIGAVWGAVRPAPEATDLYYV